LKNTIRETVPAETIKDILPPMTLQRKTPSPRRNSRVVVDAMSLDDLSLPELEKDVSPNLFKRKSKSPDKSGSVETIIRTISPHPASPRKPEADNNDLWTTSAPSPSRRNSEKRSASPKKEEQAPEPVAPPADLGSTVMEIQTSLRRDIERLRLDMLRQFVTFRNEIGQKWEGEVDRLRAENDSLKGEMEKLRKERRERDDERNRWRLV
jgi:hypothetical protein